MPNTLSKTINPYLVEVSFTDKLKFVEKYSDYLNLVSDFKDQLQAYFEYDKAQNSCDFVNPLKNFYAKLNDKYVSFDNEFLIYYIKKYNALADEVKKAVAPSLNNKNLLTPLSDSIGILTNSETLLTDSVIPLADVNVSTYPPPFVYPANLKNKIRPLSRNIATEMSRQTTAMYRNNIVNVTFKIANASEPHGSNLVTDFDSYIRMRKSAVDATNKLSKSFDKVFKLVSYYSNINDFSGYNPGNLEMNLQTMADVSYNLKVEGSLIELDLLGKKVNQARKDLTIQQILVVSSQFQTRTQQLRVNNTANINSNKPVPLNSTAPSVAKISNNPLQAKNGVLVSEPANNKPPEPVGYTVEEKQKMAEPIKNATETVKDKKDVKVENTTNFSTAKVSTLIPEFPRMPFAFAVTSPFGIFSAVKTVICTLANLNISIKIPKIPNVFTKPDFKKIKNQINALILQAQIYIIKKILSLIPPIPDIVALIENFKKQLLEQLKKLFSCNPDNQN